MIIQEISLHNFGIYGGDFTFELTPSSADNYNRPLIIFRGKNGVGKSTLVEAIRLCLHGPLTLGSRVSQREYEAFLERRIHRPMENAELTNEAYVQVSFNYVSIGRHQQYIVKRRWKRHGTNIKGDLNIWRDGTHIEASTEEMEHLLRELVPPGITDIFFFDGEKIATLAESDDESNLLLAETIKNLLGLHFVEQLDRDLDVYLTRQDDIRYLQSYQSELELLREEEDQLRTQLSEIRVMLGDCSRQLASKKKEITIQEQRIAGEGGAFAQNERKRVIEQQRLNEAISSQTQQILDLCRGVLPFSIVPKLLVSLHNRLEHEADYQSWSASQNILNDLASKIETAAKHESYWTGVTSLPDEKGQSSHLRQIEKLLLPYRTPPIEESEVIHRVSTKKRNQLLSWINEATEEVPRQLVSALHRLDDLQSQLRDIEDDLAKVPVNQVLEPLLIDLRQLEREVGRLEAEHERLSAENSRLLFHLERIAGSKRRVSQQIADSNADDGRLKMAARTKLLLAKYQQKLTQKKLSELSSLLTKRFNQLCRKRAFIERTEINPNDFSITLFRASQPFPSSQLSAGEQQLFAIATLWALHEVSGRPFPVIIDTPLSRLDEEHRHSMLSEFFPQVAHQVVILATDLEIDNKAFEFIAPVVSHAYWLHDHVESGTAQVQNQPMARQNSMISIEEVDIHAT